MYKNMKIKKQMSLFAVVLVVIPVVIWYVTSYYYLQNQIEKSQKNYLLKKSILFHQAGHGLHYRITWM